MDPAGQLPTWMLSSLSLNQNLQSQSTHTLWSLVGRRCCAHGQSFSGTSPVSGPASRVALSAATLGTEGQQLGRSSLEHGAGLRPLSWPPSCRLVRGPLPADSTWSLGVPSSPVLKLLDLGASFSVSSAPASLFQAPVSV